MVEPAQTPAENAGAAVESDAVASGDAAHDTAPGKAAKPAKKAAKAAKKATKATKAAKKTTGEKAAPAKTAKKPAKATKATKTTKAAKAAPAKATETAPAAPAAREQPAPRTGGPRTGLPTPEDWADAAWQALRHPGEPPRRLVELAVAELGPRADAWAAWLRDTYPGAPADGIARLATWRARRHGLLLTAARVSGPVTAMVQPAASAAAQVLLVLRVAAAYGHDPVDPARVADVIALLDLDTDQSPLVRGAGMAAGVVSWARHGTRWVRRRGRRQGPLMWLTAVATAGDPADRLELLAHRAVRHFRDGKPGDAAAS